MRLILILLLSLSVSSISSAVTKRPKNLDGGSDASGDALPLQSFSNPSDMSLSLARSASAGVGYKVTDGNYCYRAVKRIIADAFGKNLGCVRGILSSGSANEAGPDLQRFGFVPDSSRCTQPGTIRVYDGRAKKGYRNSSGTYNGHIEVVGDDGMFHHFMGSSRPADERLPGRRILIGCYVPDAKKIAEGPVGKCPASYKTLKSKSVPVKNRNESGVE